MEKKKIWIVGTGMGTYETMTVEAHRKIQEAEMLIGAKRVMDGLPKNTAKKVITYDIAEIEHCIRKTKYHTYVIVLSGDTGFYSAAKRLREGLKEYEVGSIAGISSVSYFFAKIGMEWDDVKLVSAHGRKVDCAKIVQENEKTFWLTGANITDIFGQLEAAGLGGVEAIIGENLSYPTEKIRKGTVQNFCRENFETLSVLFLYNPWYKKELHIGMGEEVFIRGKVPMTKPEVRAVIMSKLQLSNSGVAYDIGAGTGSVTVELGLNIPNGMVYAIEQNPEGIACIQKNIEKFGLKNVVLVPGVAPACLTELPDPEVVFIGGSKGKLKEILLELARRKKRMRVVISAITLETLSIAMDSFNQYGFEKVEVVQLTVARGRELSGKHMLMGENPIFIISSQYSE